MLSSANNGNRRRPREIARCRAWMHDAAMKTKRTPEFAQFQSVSFLVPESRTGIKTPKQDIELIRQRLHRLQEDRT